MTGKRGEVETRAPERKRHLAAYLNDIAMNNRLRRILPDKRREGRNIVDRTSLVAHNDKARKSAWRFFESRSQCIPVDDTLVCHRDKVNVDIMLDTQSSSSMTASCSPDVVSALFGRRP